MHSSTNRPVLLSIFFTTGRSLINNASLKHNIPETIYHLPASVFTERTELGTPGGAEEEASVCQYTATGSQLWTQCRAGHTAAL